MASQEALLLLRASFSAPRVLHILRSSPSFHHAGPQAFDDRLRLILNRITNADLSLSNWSLASLPIRDGGVGIRRVSQLALPAYLSASFLTRDLQVDLLAGNSSLPDPYLDDALKRWSSSCGPFPPPEKLSSQAAWDAILIREDKAQIEEKLTSPRERAIYLAANAPHSGDWLSAMPLANCGLKLDDEAIRVGVALRLGPPCVPHMNAVVAR